MLDRATEQQPLEAEKPSKRKTASMSKYLIRRADSRDIAGVHDILTSAHVIEGTMRLPHAPISTTKERLKERHDCVQLIAECKGEVVGIAEVLTKFDTPRASHSATLNMVATRADMQRRGVCSTLLDAVIAQCTDQWGLRRLDLIVWADNASAIRLYEKFGFQHEGRHRDYVRSGNTFKDALAMARLFSEQGPPG